MILKAERSEITCSVDTPPNKNQNFSNRHLYDIPHDHRHLGQPEQAIQLPGPHPIQFSQQIMVVKA